jgi:hypothetical protein
LNNDPHTMPQYGAADAETEDADAAVVSPKHPTRARKATTTAVYAARRVGNWD